MGSDKALLAYRGSTFLQHLLDLFLPQVSPVIVVLGHNADKIRATIPPSPGVQIVINSNYRAGQLSSLQTGIRALPWESAAALVTLVDHPAVAGSTIAALVGRFESSPAPLVLPRYDGRRGHPVILSRALLDEILALPASASAKDVVHAHQHHAAYVDVDDLGVIRDVDTPADYEDLGNQRGPGRLPGGPSGELGSPG